MKKILSLMVFVAALAMVSCSDDESINDVVEPLKEVSLNFPEVEEYTGARLYTWNTEESSYTWELKVLFDGETFFESTSEIGTAGVVYDTKYYDDGEYTIQLTISRDGLSEVTEKTFEVENNYQGTATYQHGDSSHEDYLVTSVEVKYGTEMTEDNAYMHTIQVDYLMPNNIEGGSAKGGYYVFGVHSSSATEIEDGTYAVSSTSEAETLSNVFGYADAKRYSSTSYSGLNYMNFPLASGQCVIANVEGALEIDFDARTESATTGSYIDFAVDFNGEITVVE